MPGLTRSRLVLQGRVSDSFGVGGILKTENTAAFLLFWWLLLTEELLFFHKNASHTDGTVKVTAEYLLRKGINKME